MKKIRDSQRSKLYKAENVLDGVTKRYETLQEIETFITAVLSRAAIIRRYGPYLTGTIHVRDGRGTHVARGGANFVKLPKWARSAHIIMHELAHTLTSRMYGETVAVHGREFAEVYLDLVRFGIDVETHDQLKASFKTARVKFRPKRGAAPVQRRIPVSRGELRVKAELPAPRPVIVRDRREGAAYREFRRLAREHGFTYKIDRERGTNLAWLETNTFPNSNRPYTTMHMGWIETLDRVERCIADPTLIDSGGGYSE